MAAVTARSVAAFLVLHAAAAVAGLLAWSLHVPLPWTIGPMVFAVFVNLYRGSTTVPYFTRPLGQMVIAGVVGLSFTPSAVDAVAKHFFLMLGVSAATIAAGVMAGAVLRRLARIDPVTAALASIPGGPAEMAALAARHGAVPGTVALVQAIRIFVLVLTLPPLLVAVDGTGQTALLAPSAGGPDPGAWLLLAIAAAGGVTFHLLRLTSPFFLGALAFSATAAAFSLPISMPPMWLLGGAQVLLGVWLGTMFDRALIVKGRRFLLAALASTAVLMALSAGLAVAVAAFAGIHWETMVLSTAPGGVTEMALTARILHQDVATVTAFQIARIFVTLALAPLIFTIGSRFARRFGRKRNASPPDEPREP